MERDTDVFVNQQALYEKIGQLLEDLDADVYTTTADLKSFMDKEWVPKDIRREIESSIKYSQWARNKIEEIHKILQTERHKGTKTVVDLSRKRIESITVIKGGLYKPPEPETINNGILSDAYKSWRKDKA